MATGGRFIRIVIAIGACACALSPGGAAGGLDPESNTDGFNPALESYRRGEQRRTSAIARQLDLVHWMQWANPYFPGEGPIEQPIGYESKQVGPDRWIYRPIYSQDVAPPVEALPEPAVEAPAPADAAPGDFIPPKDAAERKPARPGPREF